MSKAETKYDEIKRWVIELSRCKAKGVGFASKMLGAVIREHVNVRTLTVFAGTPKLAELTGWHERDVKARRSALRDAGWLVDTGERRNRAIVWSLTVPDCPCGAHGAPVQVGVPEEPGTDADDVLSPEEQAEILTEFYGNPEPVPATVPEAAKNPYGFSDEPPF